MTQFVMGASTSIKFQTIVTFKSFQIELSPLNGICKCDKRSSCLKKSKKKKSFIFLFPFISPS